MLISDKYWFKDNEILTLDLHNMTYWFAKAYVESILKTVDETIKEIVIIHGHSHGNALQKMVRNDIHSKKVKHIFLSLNPGITSFILI